jgi:DNA-binding beta-propeller fold protein YncE
MRRFHLVFAVALGMLTLASALPHMTPLISAQIPAGQMKSVSSGSGPYKVLKVAKVGGDGGFDYVNADSDGRRLYVCRSGPMGRIMVFDLDTLEQVGEVASVSGHGAVVDPKTNHGFTTSKPIAMFDSKTFATLKTIDVQGNPDGILFDPSSERVYDLSHAAPHVTVIDAKDGSIVGTIDLGGQPEQAVTDGKGHLYIDLEDKDKIAVVDAKSMMLTTTYDLAGKGGTCAALAFDVKNHILFAGCRNPANMVILNSDDGKIITTIPIGVGTDGAVFNPNTMEAFTSQGDGTLTVVKENSPTSFALEQTVQTMVSAKTLTLDSKTGHILLIAAEYGPPPATPPAGTPPGRPARGPMVPGSFSVLMVGVGK